MYLGRNTCAVLLLAAGVLLAAPVMPVLVAGHPVLAAVQLLMGLGLVCLGIFTMREVALGCPEGPRTIE